MKVQWSRLQGTNAPDPISTLIVFRPSGLQHFNLRLEEKARIQDQTEKHFLERHKRRTVTCRFFQFGEGCWACDFARGKIISLGAAPRPNVGPTLLLNSGHPSIDCSPISSIADLTP